MSRNLAIPLTVTAVALFVVALIAEPALAASTTPEDAGANLGDLIRKNTKPLVLSVAGVIGIFAIGKRDFLLALMLIGLTIMVLGFLIEPSPYEGLSDDVLDTVFGNSATVRLR